MEKIVNSSEMIELTTVTNESGMFELNGDWQNDIKQILRARDYWFQFGNQVLTELKVVPFFNEDWDETAAYRKVIRSTTSHHYVCSSGFQDLTNPKGIKSIFLYPGLDRHQIELILFKFATFQSCTSLTIIPHSNFGPLLDLNLSTLTIPTKTWSNFQSSQHPENNTLVEFVARWIDQQPSYPRHLEITITEENHNSKKRLNFKFEYNQILSFLNQLGSGFFKQLQRFGYNAFTSQWNLVISIPERSFNFKNDHNSYSVYRRLIQFLRFAIDQSQMEFNLIAIEKSQIIRRFEVSDFLDNLAELQTLNQNFEENELTSDFIDEGIQRKRVLFAILLKKMFPDTNIIEFKPVKTQEFTMIIPEIDSCWYLINHQFDQPSPELRQTYLTSFPNSKIVRENLTITDVHFDYFK